MRRGPSDIARVRHGMDSGVRPLRDVGVLCLLVAAYSLGGVGGRR
ncbi:hypothetical protein NSERUTF1_5768 [Nocardia seriolae]|nr:hypothetical protein NSERUTF1_5768 [Nocardia seriolae]